MRLIENNRLLFDRLADLVIKPPLFEPSPARFWNDPYIAQQMLKAHLDPTTDAASRRPETIERCVAWIAERAGLLPGARLLDLGCGPGLYARRFAGRDLRVTGVDFSENSLAYARQHDPHSTYIHADYRTLDLPPESFEAAVLIYGDLCVLNDADRDTVLHNVRRALCPGGYFFFDVMTPQHSDYHQPSARWWVETSGGFWKPSPYLALLRHHQYPEHETGLEQYLVIEDSGDVTEYRIWSHYYSPEAITAVLERQGFEVVGRYGNLTGAPYQPDGEWLGLAARRM
jgi:ubiquinone/menaquinone biosynthesis C-methylase UbiE